MSLRVIKTSLRLSPFLLPPLLATRFFCACHTNLRVAKSYIWTWYSLRALFIVSVSQTKLEPDRQTGLRNSKKSTSLIEDVFNWSRSHIDLRLEIHTWTINESKSQQTSYRGMSIVDLGISKVYRSHIDLDYLRYTD